MIDHVLNRGKIIDALREEMIGPSPQGRPFPCEGQLAFGTEDQAYAPWHQSDTGEEILQSESPTKRYGVGVLYPADTPAEVPVEQQPGVNATDDEERSETGPPAEEMISTEVQDVLTAAQLRGGNLEATADDDLDLSTANSFRPSSIGVSFLTDCPQGTVLKVEARGGRYQKRDVSIPGNTRQWWLRSPVSIAAEFDADALLTPGAKKVRSQRIKASNTTGIDLQIELYSRPQANSQRRLITVCLVNRTQGSSSSDELCLFQSSFQVTFVSAVGEALILPYPRKEALKPDNEEKSLSLLYHKMETFAVGHGCAADWKLEAGLQRASQIVAECLPWFETPSITSEAQRQDKSLIEVSMGILAGLVPNQDGLTALTAVITEYEHWINEREAEASILTGDLRDAADRHLAECTKCAQRMHDGLTFLNSDPRALRAFQLANNAILIQQVRGLPEPRGAAYNNINRSYEFEVAAEPDPLNPPPGRGAWRAFQIAFLLMSLRSSIDGAAADRKTVELIWFPTGGGKTEAYLGLAAFTLFFRRLKDQNDTGVSVLMRYTLRLLTTQQFQRAAGLVCAMEHLRDASSLELGMNAFSIGVWLGGATTPNSNDDARAALQKLERQQDAENPFLIGRCPWCRAQMGRYDGRVPARTPRVLGYVLQALTVRFQCPDQSCPFHGGLPIYVIDEEVYSVRPSIVIGTVDKFASLAWQSKPRTLFGIGSDGSRDASPPGLIIQDELHLISGPLGSVVGLYEAVIEELCTDRRGNVPVPPKIVCSTATIRRYSDQVKALYSRDETALFPPPGLEAGDSFFARYARAQDGTLLPGRLYLGVLAPGLSSLQTAEVRTFTALLQASYKMTPDERDPWWSLLIFFMSIRELGGALTLFQSDIPDRLKILKKRFGVDFNEMRRIVSVLELTGRLRSDEIPQAISALEVSAAHGGRCPVDVCLASNIIEVGVDIDRLSLMAVVGQPLTTSQYIQVTGRVGRRWKERPGLVVTLYSPTKPRDRSHYEKFRTYHERLYAQVEPTSVTPFCPPVLDRALHAVITAYIRQEMPCGANFSNAPYPFPADLVRQVRDILLPRVRAIDPGEATNFEAIFDKRIREWQNWKPTVWQQGMSAADGGSPLLRDASAYSDELTASMTWPTPRSMRSTDAECQAEVSHAYAIAAALGPRPSVP